jgi:hypothetical protein
MPLRRIFLVGTASLATLAALIAVATVLVGSFGETEGKIFATMGATFVAGSTLLAGVALLERDDARVLGYAAAIVAVCAFVLWTEQIWVQHDSSAYGRALGAVAVWAVAALLACVARLMTRSKRLRRTLFRATFAATAGAAVTATVLVARQNGDGWQLLAVLLILALLGETLTPILDRLERTRAEPAAVQERMLGVVAGAAVIAVKNGTGRRAVDLDGRRVALADDEVVVVRPS